MLFHMGRNAQKPYVDADAAKVQNVPQIVSSTTSSFRDRGECRQCGLRPQHSDVVANDRNGPSPIAKVQPGSWMLRLPQRRQISPIDRRCMTMFWMIPSSNGPSFKTVADALKAVQHL